MLLAFVMLSGCGGGGGGGDTPPPAPTSVTISGRITFDRIPFKSAGSGLNPGAPVESPARMVPIEAIDASANTVLATATTDANGNYSVQVPSNRSLFIRAKAETVKTGSAPTWNFRVLNNTNGNALYVLDGAAASSGNADSTRNLKAASGWSGTAYTGTRAAAPFAILDTVYTARQIVVDAVATTAFPGLDLYWSTTNKPTDRLFCTSSGDIGTTFYTNAATNAGNCTETGPILGGIYILGDFTQLDTDEFDQHVIAHEFGHYLEDNFSRSDSVGGDHGANDRLDFRVAFGEGWGDAYSGMVLNDPVYRDSQSGMNGESGFNLESPATTAPGWFSELSIAGILWDLFDATADAGDQIDLDFAAIYSVFTGPQRTTPAQTSIFPFADGLRSANPTQAAAINALLTREQISANSDAFGNNEGNDGGVAVALPIYRPIVANAQSESVCGSNGDEHRNKLGYRQFLTLSVTNGGLVTISATGQAANADPDIVLHTVGETFVSDAVGQTETITQRPLAAGTHIIEVYDYNATLGGVSCTTVSVTGTIS
jgi:hypothetical protein